jgi:hypothetical protein
LSRVTPQMHESCIRFPTLFWGGRGEEPYELAEEMAMRVLLLSEMHCWLVEVSDMR